MIDGLSGGYHYPRNKPGAPLPTKDGFYDDVMDSVRYAAENFLRPAIRDEHYLEDQIRKRRPVIESVAGDPWRWMIVGAHDLTRITEHDFDPQIQGSM